MFKRDISYKDYDGNSVTETLRFNLNNPELMTLQASYPEGFSKHLENALENNDKKEVIILLQNLILSSYGEKSVDGRRFLKSMEIKKEFEQSAAYDALFTELLIDPTGQKAVDFVNALFENIPKIPASSNE